MPLVPDPQDPGWGQRPQRGAQHPELRANSRHNGPTDCPSPAAAGEGSGVREHHTPNSVTHPTSPQTDTQCHPESLTLRNVPLALRPRDLGWGNTRARRQTPRSALTITHPVTTTNTRTASSTPFISCSPRSSNATPADVRASSRTVPDTSVSPAAEAAATRAAMFTAPP